MLLPGTAVLAASVGNGRWCWCAAQGESGSVLAVEKDVFSPLLSGEMSQDLLLPGKQRLEIVSVWVTEGEGEWEQSCK